ncbi:MAG TPA: hypothetical protein VF623_13745 [Segetibacter sp.]|jgi:hypothetical protein
MSKPTYSLDILEIVINMCNLPELILVSVAVKNELDVYEMSEIKQLFHFINERYLSLQSLKKKEPAGADGTSINFIVNKNIILHRSKAFNLFV